MTEEANNLPRRPLEIEQLLTDDDPAPLPEKYLRAKAALQECWEDGERVSWKEQMTAMSYDEKFEALGSYARMSEDKSLEKMVRRIRNRATKRLTVAGHGQFRESLAFSNRNFDEVDELVEELRKVEFEGRGATP